MSIFSLDKAAKIAYNTTVKAIYNDGPFGAWDDPPLRREGKGNV